jgi:hypothetical protein
MNNTELFPGLPTRCFGRNVPAQSIPSAAFTSAGRNCAGYAAGGDGFADTADCGPFDHELIVSELARLPFPEAAVSPLRSSTKRFSGYEPPGEATEWEICLRIWSNY